MEERRLKLRFRILDSSVQGKVDVAASCTVREVQTHICSGVAGLDATGVSLDKMALLSEDDLLAATGVCSGDLLWVHTTSPMNVVAPAARSSLAAPMPPRPEKVQSQLVPPAERGVAKRQKAADAAPCLRASSSVAAAIPICVPAGAAADSGGILQMAAALHAVLVDSGFAAVKDMILAQDCGLPISAQPSNSTVTLRYELAGGGGGQAAALRAMVRCSRMGGFLLAAGAVEAGAAHETAAGVAHHVSLAWMPRNKTTAAGGAPSREQVPLAEVLEDAGSFTVVIKDGLVRPLISDLCRAAGLTPPVGLLSLPPDVRHAVLALLQAEDLARLSCVCTEMRQAAATPELWRPLFEAEFGEVFLAESVAGARGWKLLFGTRYRERRFKMHHQRRAPNLQLYHARHAILPERPLPTRTPFIGGDFDRLPHPVLGLRAGTGRGGNRGSLGGFFGGVL